MSIGGQSNSFADDINSEPKPIRDAMTPPVFDTTTTSLSSPLMKHHSIFMPNHEWTTANWTSIFLHFHSAQHDHCMYLCVMLIGIVFISIIFSVQLFIIPPSTFILCRYLNWVLFIFFLYILTFFISYSKLSNKKWCSLRDYVYVLLWIYSSIGVSFGIIIKCIPFKLVVTKRMFSYVNCAHNDYDCIRYKDKYGLTQFELDLFHIISHCIPFLYCIVISSLFAHRNAFKAPCKDQTVVCLATLSWYLLNVLAYLVTDKWNYKGMDDMFRNNAHGTNTLVLYTCIIFGVILCATFVIYWMCYWLHHRCKLCEHNYSPFFKAKIMTAKMEEKERELMDMPNRDDAFSRGIAL